jgi:hypothetical protein
MAAEPFNSIGGFSTGIPEVVVVDSSGNVVTNVLTSGNVAASTVYSGVYKYSNGAPLTAGVGSLVLPKTSGQGLLVDMGAPTYGWRDLLGSITVEESGGPNRPTFTNYRDGLKQYRFDANDQCFVEFHLPHDYAPGTDLFIHVHWSHIASDVSSGGITWGFEMSYAKGHNQAPFSPSVTATVLQAASLVQFQHMIAETQVTGSSLIPVGDIEPDGILLTRIHIVSNDIAPATLPYVHYVDIHYQSTGMGTKQKAPNFYI